MTDQPTTRNQLIEQAGHVGAFLSGARGVTVLKPWPEVAERLLTWMSERGWLADPEQPAALLSRLADLAETAGKLRSTEWLRTCATLPPEQWPPAPGYKGPMVPAAEVEELRAELEEHKAIAARDEAAVNRARAERDLALWLHAEATHRAEELTAFAGEQANARRESDRIRNIAAREAADLRDERDTARAQLAEKTEYAGEKAREGDVLSLEVEDLTAERDALQARIGRVAAVLDRPWPDDEDHHDFVNQQVEDARATLQGDQPTEPQPLSEIELIAAERRRVVAEEGRTPESDDAYEFGQLLYAAAAYIGANVGAPQTLHPGKLWPWEFRHFKPRDPIANLVKAGQLIAAEIARLQRAAVAESATSPPDLSGRIVDHGPIQPFTDTDRGEQP